MLIGIAGVDGIPDRGRTMIVEGIWREGSHWVGLGVIASPPIESILQTAFEGPSINKSLKLRRWFLDCPALPKTPQIV